MIDDPTRHDLLVSTPDSKPLMVERAGNFSAIDRPAPVRGTMTEINVHVRQKRSARSLHELWGRHDPWEDRQAWARGPAGRNSDAEGIAEEGACK